MKHLSLMGLVLCGLLLALPASSAPEIQHWQTESATDVYFVPTPGLPMIDLRLVFHAGSARDAELSGVANLTSALLNQGAGEWSADQIAARFESVGAEFDYGSKKDMAWLSLRSLTQADWFETAFSTYLAIVGQPQFNSADFERVRSRILVGLKRQEQKPSSVASKAFYKAIYGEHPYGAPTDGTLESVQALELAAVKAFHKQFYVAQNANLAIVGDISTAEAKALAQRVSAVLGKGEKAAPLPPVPALTEAKHIEIPFPTSQAHVLIGQVGIQRGADDYYALYLGNHSLGGSGFSSRLMQEVRVERGLSYSVYSYFLPMAAAGPYIMGLQTRVDQAQQAETVVKQTLSDFLAAGQTAEEIQSSKNNIIGGFPLRTASNSDLVEYVAMIGFYGLPLDYLNRFTDYIDALDQQTVLQTYRDYIKPERLVTVIVGGDAPETVKEAADSAS